MRALRDGAKPSERQLASADVVFFKHIAQAKAAGSELAMLKVAHQPGFPSPAVQIRDCTDAVSDCTNAVEGKFVGLLIWGKYIARFLDGKVWEVRKTPPRKDITHGSKVTLIEAKTKLKDSNSSKNLWRICFTATFDGYETFSTGDFGAYYSKHRVTSDELATYLQQGTSYYFWKFKDVALVQPAEYIESDSRVIWVDYSTLDIKLGHPSWKSIFGDAKRSRLGL